jgi:glycosyltransferase involved in cell wall biosynthesis
MRLRLSFAIATAIDPDIVLLNEPFGAGDAFCRREWRDALGTILPSDHDNWIIGKVRMSLSVVLPNFNHAYVISRALGAIARQIPAAKEIIVVDDGSTDDSIEVIERLCREYRSIRLIRHESNRGTAAAMITALEAISGEYVYFAAADDFVFPGLFARAVSALEANPAAAFFCSEVAVVDRAAAVVGFRPFIVPRWTGGYISPHQARLLFRSSDNWFVGASVIYRRQHLAEVGYFDVSLGSLCDAMTNRLLALRYGFYFAPEILAAFSFASDTLSGRSALSLTESRRLIDFSQRWIEQHFPPDVRGSYSRLFERRLRFGMARLWLVWRNGRLNSRRLAELLNFGRFDRAVIRMASRTPFVASSLVLAWMAIRMRPFGVLAVLKAWVRHVALGRLRRRRYLQYIAGLRENAGESG